MRPHEQFEADGGGAANLKQDRDAIVFADEDPAAVKAGRPSPSSRAFRCHSAPPLNVKRNAIKRLGRLPPDGR